MNNTGNARSSKAVDEAGDCALCATCGTERLFGDPLNQLVHDFGKSALYLHENQHWRGYCLLVWKVHVVELFELSAEERAELIQDLSVSAEAIWKACSPDKLNYKSVGNVIPHLHWHIQPRYRSLPEGLTAMTNRDAPKEHLTVEDAQRLAKKIAVELSRLLGC